MKTLITTNSSAIMFNPDDQSVKYVNRDRNCVDNVYYITEECDVKALYNDQDGKEVEVIMHAQPGDILVHFWNRTYPNKYALIKSDEWKNNIESYRAEEQRQKEEWAAKNSEAKEPEADSCDNLVKAA